MIMKFVLKILSPFIVDCGDIYIDDDEGALL